MGFQTISPLKACTRLAPQNSRILLERIFPKVVKRIVKFEILNSWHFFWPFNMVVNWEL